MSLVENRLFIRDSEITIYQKAERLSPASQVVPLDAIQPKTRLKFDIKKTTDSSSNKAKITIYNLAPTSRAFLEKDNLVVLLKAGYLGGIARIFFGDLKRKITERKGPDVFTEMECGDTEDLLTDKKIQLSLGKDATLQQVLNFALGELGLTPERISGFKDKVFKNGFTFSGTVTNLIDYITTESDQDWSIQDGELQILGKDLATSETAVVVSPETGLIGFPTKTKDGIEFKSLLNPGIRPGRVVQVRSKQFRGLFGVGADGGGSRAIAESGGFTKAALVHHKGDTRGAEWSTKCEGVPTAEVAT